MIFARRSIQKFIDRLSGKLPQEAIGKLVQKLNRNDRQSLDFEWEVSLLFALEQIGTVEYEICHGGKSLPDVTFRLPGKRNVCFVAEVATVSDRGLEEENPVRMFEDFLHEKTRAFEIPGGFSYSVEGTPVGERYWDRKVKLAMPGRKKLRAFLEKHLTPRLREIKESGLEEADISINEESFRISITYRKGGTGFSGGHVSYTAAYSLHRNPVYTSLKGKARRLAQSDFGGCKGIFLCDGWCDLLDSQFSSSPSYGIGEIIGDFLRQNSSISFVVTLWVKQPYRGVFDGPQHPRLHVKVFPNPTARFPLSNKTAQSLQKIPALLPKPVNEAVNAVYRIEAGRCAIGETHYGGSTLRDCNDGISIRISSRALLDLLAGKIDPSKFTEDHWPAPDYPGTGRNNPFVKAIDWGMMIETLSIERKEDEDDDWITFKLAPDVALKPFHHR